MSSTLERHLEPLELTSSQVTSM
ncbi:unnamed protein product, partial [Allacma fusca]